MNPIFRTCNISVFALMLWLQTGHADPIAPPRFTTPSKGDTLLFCGDSITHHNHYIADIGLFYATRYPDRPLHMVNAGVAGNRCGSALLRFRQDVANEHPSQVFVLFGMNDGSYRPFDADIFTHYQKGMNTILSRIAKETEAGVILLTPTFYDHQERVAYLPPEKESCAEYNQTLTHYGRYLQELGKEKDIPVIDLHAPMQKVTEALRRADPEATLTRDGVHPTPSGHLVMAYAILKGLGEPGIVSTIELDCRTREVKTERCQVEALAIEPDQIRFTVTPEALPFPVAPELQPLLEVLPFMSELNREILRVINLSHAKYTLSIDGLSIGTFAREDLAAGINLAGNANTPQHKQAAIAAVVHRHIQQLVWFCRKFRWMEKVRGYQQPDGSYTSDKCGRYTIDGDDWATEIPETVWQREFDFLKQAEPGFRKAIRELEKQLYDLCKPVTHDYELTAVQ